MAKGIRRIGLYLWSSKDGNVRMFWRKGLHLKGVNGYMIYKDEDIVKTFPTRWEALKFMKGLV